METVTAPSNPLQVLTAGDLESGVWSFQDERWDLTAESHDNATARTLIFTAPQPTQSTSHVHREGAQDLLRLLREYGKRIRTGPYCTYELKYQGIQVVAFEYEQPPCQFVSIRWLIPLANGRSWIIEQKPRSDSTDSDAGAKRDFVSQANSNISSESTTGLSREFKSESLFLHWPHQILARRYDHHGRMLCLLVQVDATLDGLIEGLSRDSWKIGVPETKLLDVRTSVHLTRGSDAYWLIVIPVSGVKTLHLLLIRDDPSSGKSDNSVLADEESL